MTSDEQRKTLQSLGLQKCDLDVFKQITGRGVGEAITACQRLGIDGQLINAARGTGEHKSHRKTAATAVIGSRIQNTPYDPSMRWDVVCYNCPVEEGSKRMGKRLGAGLGDEGGIVSEDLALLVKRDHERIKGHTAKVDSYRMDLMAYFEDKYNDGDPLIPSL